ncbi:MAG: hypothetical protein AAGE59_03410 [Cyanobacteria bacterium P01_F01_bin.86]
MLWQWTVPLVLAVAIGELCWSLGSVRGLNKGQLNVAGYWGNGVENDNYWRQVRKLNREATLKRQQQERFRKLAQAALV